MTDVGLVSTAGAPPPEDHVRKRIPAALHAYKWVILVIVLVVGFGGWEGYGLLLGPVVAGDRAKRGDLIETVVATGSVQTPFRVDISSQITGTVETVQVEEGQHVTKGQPPISLESQELKADVVQAEGAVAQAEAHMRQLQELSLPTARTSLVQAQASLINAQQTFDRASKLAASGDATRVALDAAQKDLDVASSQVRATLLQVYTDSPGGSDYVTGQTQLSQAQAALATAKSRLGYADIAAPRAGMLIARSVERGAVVQAGGTLLSLAPDGQMQLLLAIDERNLSKVALQQKAVASADAYADKKFPAVVSYINPGVDITRASVEVKLDVADPPPYLLQDMTVSVDIEVGRSENALVVPGRSVHDALSASPWVMVVKNGRTSKQPVRLGLQGITETEILSGIAEGDVVISASSTVPAGQRVRVVAP